jgi:CubicO group peptidase (beta-lactamase class C family)
MSRLWPALLTLALCAGAAPGTPDTPVGRRPADHDPPDKSVGRTGGVELAAGGTARPGEPSPEGPVELLARPPAAYARLMDRLLANWQVPGGSLAVARDGQLIFAAGYGLADRDSAVPVTPDTLFRIASISKPVTAVAILRLVEQGRLALDDRALDRLPDLVPPGGPADPRAASITLRDLLWHSGGWDPAVSHLDPMFAAGLISAAQGVPSPPGPADIIRYMLGHPLDYDPGTRHAYSNFGYCILGRVIEAVTGLGYEEAVQREVLAPMGITSMRLGTSLESGPDEVHYYGHAGEGQAQPVFPGVSGLVPWPYGGFCLESMDAHGGWLATATDLVRFASCVEGTGPWRPLTDASLATMTARPTLDQWQGSPYWYGMGWLVRPVGPAGDSGMVANWWHNGSLPGTFTLLVRTSTHRCWAALFNSRPDDWGAFNGEVDSGMWEAAAEAGLL